MTFKNSCHEIYKEDILNLNKFKKWHNKIKEVVDIKDIVINDIIFNGDLIESLNLDLIYTDKGIDKIKAISIYGSQLSIFFVLDIEGSEDKYVLVKETYSIAVASKVLQSINAPFSGSDIESKDLDLLDKEISWFVKPKFNELKHISTALLSPSMTDKNLTFMLYEKKITQSEFEEIKDNELISNNNLLLVNMNEASKTFKSLSLKFLLNDYSSNPNNRKRKFRKQDIEVIDTIKYALDNNKVFSLYHKIVDNDKAQLIQFESLMRIKNEKGESIPPTRFLDIAVRSGLYPKLTNIILDNAEEILKIDYLSLTVNLREEDINSNETKNRIYKLLDSIKDNEVGTIVFELSEDSNKKNIPIETAKFVSKVRSLGAKIIIDDLGSSEKALNEMLEIKPDFIKLRTDLIKYILTDSFCENEVQKIVNFAKKYNIKTIAPFVETEAIFEKVKSIGVDYSQGFYFGKPEELSM